MLIVYSRITHNRDLESNRCIFTFSLMKSIKDIHHEIRDARNNAKEAISNTDTDQGKALLETSFEVLSGLEKAFDHFSDKSEKAWQ